MIIMRSAVPAFVAHALAPFSTQSLPSFVACARNDAASEPASGSERAKPARISPRAIGFSQRSFCSGVPCSTTCSRTSVAVCIEPLPRFPTQLSLGHHFLEQRRGAVLAPIEPILKHLHDRQTDVETDEIGQRERSQGMIHAELHHLIDTLGG